MTKSNKPICVIMCGIPGSGKSTFCHKIINEHSNFTCVSRDAIRLSMLKDGENYFKHEKQVKKIFYNIINDKLNSNYNVIVDSTNISYNAIRYTLNHIIEQCHIYIVYIDCSLETAICRNNKRSGLAHVPKKVIQRMYDNKYIIDDDSCDERIIDIIHIDND